MVPRRHSRGHISVSGCTFSKAANGKEYAETRVSNGAKIEFNGN
jgi:hypothetical protein